ncbi:NADH dehydrogenase subunit J [Dissulfurispira thermophila]|uniref:NADH-quinone oxidoreductase subunit J n=2 Tax=root TaxID=1 RepID=A0A7G1H4F1_9BACT|nr:NADH-quinone oxidoreductase subunit J [Dissulfurispira thermophila]BCB97021.1 NADH dehydrogenase subunit J [Dissulfurispira thermophila]
MLPKIFFGYFSVVMIVLSILIITRRNPVHSVLWMLALFFHIAALYLFLNAEFLSAVQLILYAGAILVLFLFVIMMLNLKEELTAERFIGEWPIGVALGISILMFIYFAISKFIQGPTGQYTIEAIKKETHTKTIGKVLYTEYLFPFEIASLILLIAIVGAIVLAKKKRSEG